MIEQRGFHDSQEIDSLHLLMYDLSDIQGVTEMQVQNWTMLIKTKDKTFYMNDKKCLTA